jgi:hypothetical protein
MPTVYIELHSGFGNQIFQYAFALALKTDFGFKTYLLPSGGNTHSNRNYQDLFRLVSHSTEAAQGAVVISKKTEAFKWWDVKTLEAFSVIRLSGYYQNYQLYRTVVPQIATELRSTLQNMYGPTTWNPESTAFIHVRRGDYLLHFIKQYNLQMNYYSEAIDTIQCRNPGIKFIVISDDIEWCKAQSWPTIYPVEFFEPRDELKTFWCMLNCNAAAIIANSTFSYWGAILGAHQVRSPVIYPNAWHLEETIDIFPEQWISVGSKETSLKIPS